MSSRPDPVFIVVPLPKNTDTRSLDEEQIKDMRKLLFYQMELVATTDNMSQEELSETANSLSGGEEPMIALMPMTIDQINDPEYIISQLVASYDEYIEKGNPFALVNEKEGSGDELMKQAANRANIALSRMEAQGIRPDWVVLTLEQAFGSLIATGDLMGVINRTQENAEELIKAGRASVLTPEDFEHWGLVTPDEFDEEWHLVGGQPDLSIYGVPNATHQITLPGLLLLCSSIQAPTHGQFLNAMLSLVKLRRVTNEAAPDIRSVVRHTILTTADEIMWAYRYLRLLWDEDADRLRYVDRITYGAITIDYIPGDDGFLASFSHVSEWPILNWTITLPSSDSSLPTVDDSGNSPLEGHHLLQIVPPWITEAEILLICEGEFADVEEAIRHDADQNPDRTLH